MEKCFYEARLFGFISFFIRRDTICQNKERRLADYFTSEMVEICGIKFSSTFENKGGDKFFTRYNINPNLFKMDSTIEVGGENFYPVVCMELFAILIKNWYKKSIHQAKYR